jgi:hypothetical protein
MKRLALGFLITLGMAGAAPAQTAPAPPKTWVDYTTLKADLRYRVERIDDASKTYNRNRDRIRARLGVEVKPNDLLKVAIGLSTGQSDPISGNQTLTDGFAKKEMRLDLAYLDYNFFGDKPDEVHFLAGRMKNPFLTQNDDLTWDPDLTPEGLALKGQMTRGLATFYAQAGSFWIKERDPGSETMLAAGQAAVRLQFRPEFAVTLGGAYDRYDNMMGYDVIDWEGKNNSYGNSTVNGTGTNKAWATGFEPVVWLGQVDFWMGGLPIALFGQVSHNGKADKFGDAHMFGLSVGKAKNPETFEIGWSYAAVQKDAVPGMFTDSDRWGGGTDGKGHKVYARYQLAKGLQAGVTYFNDKKKIADPTKQTDYNRLQIDLIGAF